MQNFMILPRVILCAILKFIPSTYLHTERPPYADHHLLPVIIQSHEERRLADVHVVRRVDDLDVPDVPQLLQDGVVALAAVVLDDLRGDRLLARKAAAGEVGT